MQYFTASPDLLLYGVRPYAELTKEEKEGFLQYDVVVRDLGLVEIDILRTVFQRINATRYALNAMEIHNSRFEGAFKAFGEEFAQRPFFERHRIFSASEIRRMQDARFALILACTVLSTYFNRDDELEDFLTRFNDEFPMRTDLERELDTVLEFLDQMDFPSTARIWKKADLFTVMVEVHTALFRHQEKLTPTDARFGLAKFYAQVDNAEQRDEGAEADRDPSRYYKAALQATNDRGSRIVRGEIIQKVLDASRVQGTLEAVLRP